jgi:hypothetical protein
LGKHVSRQGDLLQTYYKITSLIIHYLGLFAVGEAPASVRRTQLAVAGVNAQTAASPVNGTFSITEVDEALTEGFQGIASGLI